MQWVPDAQIGLLGATITKINNRSQYDVLDCSTAPRNKKLGKAQKSLNICKCTSINFNLPDL